jgi:hypothetical protein
MIWYHGITRYFACPARNSCKLTQAHRTPKNDVQLRLPALQVFFSLHVGCTQKKKHVNQPESFICFANTYWRRYSGSQGLCMALEIMLSDEFKGFCMAAFV